MEYVNRKRYKKKCICGDVNFPYHTKFDCLDNGLITYKNKPICYNTSQDAFDYFIRNDYDFVECREKLIDKILSFPKNNSIWQNDYLKNYRKDNKEVWIWNYNFFNATLDELVIILDIITNAKEIK